MKEISKQGMDMLIRRGVIRHAGRGYVDKHGKDVGFYRTKGCAGKRYIMDMYADMLAKFKN